jgi:hypothetical protein
MPDPEQAHREHGLGAPPNDEAARNARTAPAAWIALALLAALWAVWAWQYGGWFGTATYPGTAVLAAGLILLALFAPHRARLRGWPAVGLGGIIALGLWSAVSALWSPSPDVAVEDAQRILAYAVAFGLGLWLCDLLGARMHLAMAPIAFAGLFAGALTVGTMLTSDDVLRVLDAGTLQYPIGYRNANAAFFLIALWPALGLAATRELDWRLRALSLGVATLCLQLGALSQSRASMIAGGVAVVVYLAANRDRARAVVWLALAVGPALIVLPALTDLYHAADELGRQQTLSELRAAGHSVVLGAGVAIVLGAIAALLERRFPASEAALRRANRAVGVGAVGLAVAGLAGFVVATGDPLEWISDRAEEFQSTGTPQVEGSSTRFAFNAGTERDDLWRVALDDAGEDPLLGTGGGGYYYSYLRERSGEGVQSAHDAHSIEFEVLGELGIPGLAMLALALVGAVGGAVRARRMGPPATALSACALTTAAYWLAHASVDWHWPFPALTAPVLALLGSACAPTILGKARSFQRGRGRWLIVAGGLILALSVVPPYLSERYVNQAFATWPTDREAAFEDLGHARDLNPLDEDPLLAEGGIALAAGDEARAIDAFELAARKRPEEWAIHYFLAVLYEDEDPARARREFELAAEQNPLSPRIENARGRFDQSGG